MSFRTEQLAEGVTLILGDCLEVLPALGMFDAIITDPPFGIADKAMLDLPGRGGRGNNTYHKASEWDHSIDARWPAACADHSKLIAWFGHWRKRGEVEAAMPMPLRAEIIWAKDTHVGPPCPVAMRDERIWLFGEKGIKGATFETSVWDVPIIPTWAFKHHKNEKPVPLMERLIAFLGAGSILDPFAGSGSTGVAAIRLGKHFTGIEQDPTHFDTACRRLEAALREPSLFIAPPKPAEQLSILDGAA
jgi:hypothetical protein